MESQEEIVLDPVTHLPVEDETLKIAIKEGTHYIKRRGRPKTIVDWGKFMQRRKTYMGIPRYFGLTDREVQTYMKISREALVPIQIIGRVWGKPHRKFIVEFLIAKKIPVYRWPSGKGKFGYHVFSGDIVRAIESCRIDLEADGGAWGKYMVLSEKWWEKRKEIDAARRRGDPDAKPPREKRRPQGNQDGRPPEGFDGRA